LNIFIILPIALLTEIFGVKGVDFDGNQYTNMLAMYLQSIVICYAILLLCSAIFKSRLRVLSLFGRDTIILFGYNYTINTLLLTFLPFIESTWIMAFLVIVMGGVLVFIANMFPILKRVLV